MIYTCIKYPLPGFIYIFDYNNREFSCIFEPTVKGVVLAFMLDIFKFCQGIFDNDLLLFLKGHVDKTVNSDGINTKDDVDKYYCVV